MKNLILCFFIILFINSFSCTTSTKDKAFKVFNEGVSYSLDAGNAAEKGNGGKALQLNKQAIEKFKETLKIDPTYKIARSALAHSLYLDKQYNEAITWFEKSNKIDGPAAINFLELGLCRVNIGQVKLGREAIEKAMALDKSTEMRKNAVDDLEDIGTLAFSFGKEYIAKGDTSTGKTYQHFSVTVLMMAFDFDNGRKDVSAMITQYADEIQDKSAADQYRNK